MCEALRWSELVASWFAISFSASLAVINIGIAVKLRREREATRELLELVSREHTRIMVEHMEVMN